MPLPTSCPSVYQWGDGQDCVVPTEAKIGSFEDEERAGRTVRWLLRSGLHARIVGTGETFEVVVPSGREEERAQSVLRALAHTREPTELPKPAGWDWVRSHVLRLESLATVLAVVVGTMFLFFIGIWLWALAGMLGWLGLIVVVVAGLVFFHFSGIPHSAVQGPRRYSHKHDVTMGLEQEVQYRLAWARDQYRKSRRWPPPKA